MSWAVPGVVATLEHVYTRLRLRDEGSTAIPETLENVGKIVRKMLEQRFADDFVFDPNRIMPTRGFRDADPYLKIMIVFDGDQKRLDPGWTGGLTGRLPPKLAELGIEDFPITYFIKKSEWPQMSRHLDRAGA